VDARSRASLFQLELVHPASDLLACHVARPPGQVELGALAVVDRDQLQEGVLQRPTLGLREQLAELGRIAELLGSPRREP
jgi:hypothetical protein